MCFLEASKWDASNEYSQHELTLKMPRKPASENVVCLCCLLNILANFSNLFLHTGKHCGPWSDIVWTGSTWFAKMTFKITKQRTIVVTGSLRVKKCEKTSQNYHQKLLLNNSSVWMANSVDPDQTIYNNCSGMYVQTFRVNTAHEMDWPNIRGENSY